MLENAPAKPHSAQEETKAHERRAERSDYLREKLEERAESEREER